MTKLTETDYAAIADSFRYPVISYKGVSLYLSASAVEFGVMLHLRTPCGQELSSILAFDDPDSVAREWSKAIRSSDALDSICDAWNLWPAPLSEYITHA
jgi:hypothetical protein